MRKSELFDCGKVSLLRELINKLLCSILHESFQLKTAVSPVEFCSIERVLFYIILVFAHDVLISIAPNGSWRKCKNNHLCFQQKKFGCQGRFVACDA